MKNKMEDLRNHLFASLERLSDEESEISKDMIAREQTIANVAGSIINAAKLELQHMRMVGAENVTPAFFPQIDKRIEIGSGAEPPKQIDWSKI